MSRFIYVVLDGVGAGELPDAAEYGDEGSNTLGNLSHVSNLRLPFLESLGLGNILPLRGVAPVTNPAALVGRLAPRSVGKDSTVGHWEQMGLVTTRPFPTFPAGFPPHIIEEFIRLIGRQVLGNCAASGTEIISRLGDEHLATGYPIVYTSVDSVFQIAAHERAVPLRQLYEWCVAARALLAGEDAVARVIARPFAGASGSYARTSDRRDFSLVPPGPTYLDRLSELGIPVLALGKVGDIFAGRGISTKIKVTCNEENLAVLCQLVEGQRSEGGDGLVMSNLVDFDTAWGHRNDVDGFARGLEYADRALAHIASILGPEDRLLITADHGVDPTTPSTDHSREYVPLLLYPRPPATPAGVYEGEFSDAGATAFECLTGAQADLEGCSVTRMRPARGWRRNTPMQSRDAGTVANLPGRVGVEEAKAAGLWLADNLGAAPDMAVVLGSGLSLAASERDCPRAHYVSIPGWRAGEVPGHPYCLSVKSIDGRRWAVLEGRIHEYEGFDLSEVQLPIRSLATWGVRRVALTSAGGAVRAGLVAGDVVVVDQVMDLQYRATDGCPVMLSATPDYLCAVLAAASQAGTPGLRVGIHVSVPGPQYETPAELQALRAAGAATVSMTPAGELRAVHDEGMRAAVLTVVTNSGETTHGDVLTAADRAANQLTTALQALCESWT